jgi:protoporphyrinogen oxidase
MGAAFVLARAGWTNVTIVERGRELGGLAGTFRQGERFYPLAYHHILHRDRALLYFLDLLGVLDRVRWRRIRMLFRMRDRSYDLAHPVDFARFPMTFADKLRFVRLMTRCFRKSDWSDWNERSAAELVDGWAGRGVREALFEPLTQLKFRLPCSAVSASWLGARLHFREGSAPLGYMPGTNWTWVLCRALGERLAELGVRIRLQTEVRRVATDGKRATGVETSDGEALPAEIVISTLPTEIYRRIAPDDRTPELERIRYTAVVSAICATRARIASDFYWMNLPTLDRNACGIFRLESLNPTIGGPGESCVNFVTHLPHRDEPMFRLTDEQLLSGYAEDFRTIFGVELSPAWLHVSRLPMYSPVFSRGYRNPPVGSASLGNVFFAGNYRTFPSIASTGTALGSGVDAATAVLAGGGGAEGTRAAIDRFRLRAMPGP